MDESHKVGELYASNLHHFRNFRHNFTGRCSEHNTMSTRYTQANASKVWNKNAHPKFWATFE